MSADTSTASGWRKASSRRRSSVDRVRLVEHEQARLLAHADRLQHVLDGARHGEELLLVRARVDHVQEQVGPPRLLQRGAERVDELVRQLADEPDRVRDEVRAALEPQHPRRRVERVEQAVAHADLAAGERVEQRRLARVRVAGQGDRRQVRPLALGAHAPGGWRRRRACGGAARRSGRGRGGGPSRSATRPGRGSRCRRPGARDASTGRACARGCTRAGRARPAACPRRSGRGRRRCRG